MTDRKTYEISTLLPHGHPMILLDELADYGESFVECMSIIDKGNLFLNNDNVIPVWVGIEYMAQAIAAHAGIVALGSGLPVKIGFLIGARRLEFDSDSFNLGQRLLIRAESTWDDNELAVYNCSIRDGNTGKLLSHGDLNVFQPDNVDEFIRKEKPR